MCINFNHTQKKNVYFMKSAFYGWIFSNKFEGEFRQASVFTDSTDFLVPQRPQWGSSPLYLEYFKYTVCKTCLLEGKLTRNLTDKQVRRIPGLKRLYILTDPESNSTYPAFSQVKIYSSNPKADMIEGNRVPGRNWRILAIDIHEADLTKIEYYGEWLR